MKCRINHSFHMEPVAEDENIVVCNDSFRQFSCDTETLKDVISIIGETGSTDGVYAKYCPDFGEETVKDFIDTLVEEQVIIPETNEPAQKVRVGIIGDKTHFDVLEPLLPECVEGKYYADVDEYIADINDYDGAILLPGAITYGELLEWNSKLYEKEKPYVLSRYTGEEIIAGPLVFPWKTPCLECHVNQHLMILNMDNEEPVTIDQIRPVLCSTKLDTGADRYACEYVYGLLLADMKKVKAKKANYLLVKQEIHIKNGEAGNAVFKSFASTTECGCCHGKNRRYKLIKDAKDLVVPENPLKQTDTHIQYSTGGLRSVSPEETAAVVEKAIANTGLNIEIKLGVENTASAIIPVYHSILETTHRNKTPYFFEAQHSYGKGLNSKQAYFSAAFELFERLSSRYYGEKEIVCGSYAKLRDYCADVRTLVHINKGIDTVYDQFDEDQEVDWIWAYSLTDGCSKLIPASIAFLSLDVFKGNFAPNGSSGMSAGASIKDAILQGLFELIEHDAWMIGQANPVRMPIITYDGLKNKVLLDNIRKLEEAGLKIISRDYTNDTGIPVIRTWISNPGTYVHYATNGFGASIYPELALERSITEAIQSGVSSIPKEVTDYARPFMKNLINARDGIYSLYYFQQKDIRPLGFRKDISTMHTEAVSSVDEALQYVLKRIKAIEPDADVLFVDFTRDFIGVPAVKVFVTKGLQVLREPLTSTSDRLMHFQQNMGYTDREVKYEELYMAPYPH